MNQIGLHEETHDSKPLKTAVRMLSDKEYVRISGTVARWIADGAKGTGLSILGKTMPLKSDRCRTRNIKVHARQSRGEKDLTVNAKHLSNPDPLRVLLSLVHPTEAKRIRNNLNVLIKGETKIFDPGSLYARLADSMDGARPKDAVQPTETTICSVIVEIVEGFENLSPLTQDALECVNPELSGTTEALEIIESLTWKQRGDLYSRIWEASAKMRSMSKSGKVVDHTFYDILLECSKLLKQYTRDKLASIATKLLEIHQKANNAPAIPWDELGIIDENVDLVHRMLVEEPFVSSRQHVIERAMEKAAKVEPLKPRVQIKPGLRNLGPHLKAVMDSTNFPSAS